jgi:hypothetical protein
MPRSALRSSCRRSVAATSQKAAVFDFGSAGFLNIAAAPTCLRYRLGLDLQMFCTALHPADLFVARDERGLILGGTAANNYRLPVTAPSP